MRRKVRRIAVLGKHYVWWYTFCENGAEVYVSPDCDKTACAKVRFSSRETLPDVQPAAGIFPGTMKLVRSGESLSVRRLSPKMASLVIVSLPENTLTSRKTASFDGYELLEMNGFNVADVINEYNW